MVHPPAAVASPRVVGRHGVAGLICKHGRVLGLCKDCGGSITCEHGWVRSLCKECQAIRAVCGRGKKSKEELLRELESTPVFIRFKKEVTSSGKIRASSVPKLLHIVDTIISNEYKKALLESTQRRTKDPMAIIEAVRQEALRKLMHEEDIYFNEAGQDNEFTMQELHDKLDEAHLSKSAHHAPVEVRPLPQPPPPPRFPLLDPSV